MALLALILLGSNLWRSNTLAEPILESSRHSLEMTHTASSSRLASLSLHAPVEAAQLCGRVGALGACLLLLVEGAVTAAAAEGVTLSMAFSEAGGSFGLRMDEYAVDSITISDPDDATPGQGDDVR
jgi:hypothetical protein